MTRNGIGLEDTETVLRSIAGLVGNKAKRYPDGETGERHYQKELRYVKR